MCTGKRVLLKHILGKTVFLDLDEKSTPKSRVNSKWSFMNLAQSLYRVLFEGKILKLNSHMRFFFFFLFFLSLSLFLRIFPFIWGGLMWKRVKHGYLVKCCPFRKRFQHQLSLSYGFENYPLNWNFIHMFSWNSYGSFWDKHLTRHGFLVSIPMPAL